MNNGNSSEKVAQSTLNARLLRIARMTLGITLIIVAFVLVIGNFTLSLLSLINSN